MRRALHRIGLSLLTPVISVLLAAVPASAQEVQVPLDEAGEVFVIDAPMEARLNLFPAYGDFREARLFRQPDGSFVLVIQYEDEETIVQDREVLADSDVAALRARVSQALVEANVRPGVDQAGRVSLLWTAAGMSFLAYGPSIAGALEIEDETAAGTIVLLTGAAGFFVPFYVTRSLPVTRAAAALTRSGSTIGYLHGVALAAFVGGENTSLQGVLGAGLAVSLAEALGGYRFATATGLRHGSVETMTAGSLFGAGLGLGTAALVLGEDVDDDDASIRTLAGLGLAGSVGGAYVGYRLSRAENYSRGDARVLSTVGLLGFEAGAALLEIADVNRTRPAAGLLIAATTAGLATGHLLAHDRDFTSSEGNFIALGTLAGGLVGAATSNLVGGSTAANAALTTLGSFAGFGIMYVGYREEAARRADRSVNLSLAPSFDPVNRSIRPGFRLNVGL